MSLLKAAALCICPVIGTGVIVQTVPAAKQAIHRATTSTTKSVTPTNPRAAHQIAAPSLAPCVVTPDLSGFADSAGFIEGVPPAAFGAPASSVAGGGAILLPSTPTPAPAIPEPDTWMMLITGFGLVGGAMRSQRKERRA